MCREGGREGKKLFEDKITLISAMKKQTELLLSFFRNQNSL
jgi:hypothetical protein